MKNDRNKNVFKSYGVTNYREQMKKTTKELDVEDHTKRSYVKPVALC